LLDEYHDQLLGSGVTGYSPELCQEHYRSLMKLKVIQPPGERMKGIEEAVWRESIDKVTHIYEDFG